MFCVELCNEKNLEHDNEKIAGDSTRPQYSHDCAPFFLLQDQGDGR